MGYPKKNRYLLLSEFSVRTVNYEPSFFFDGKSKIDGKNEDP